MAKSAMEALNRRFEEESGDTNVDIEVIVNADGEAAEDIIEATDAGETASEDVAISQENEEATQEAEEMTELAAVLRKHGLTQGMAALLKVTTPIEAYGIALPAMESLDSSGRNQAVADRIAGRLEAAVEGFWESTKLFFKKVWRRIVQAAQWVWNRLGGIKTRVKRAHASIKDRSWDPDLEKDRKFPELKEQKEFHDALKNIETGLQAGLADIKSNIEKNTVIGVGNNSSVEKDALTGTFKEEDLKKGIGYKYTESKSGIEADSTVKPETDEKSATSEHLSKCQKEYYDEAINRIEACENMAKQLKDSKTDLDIKDSRNKDKEENADKNIKEMIKQMRAKISIMSSVYSKYNAVINKLAMIYVKQCSAIRLCTK